MNPSKLIIIGTAFHYGDLLHRLKPEDGAESASGRSRVRFTWRKYAAIDTERETALWEARHPYEELLERRDFDPVSFSREFMNEPTDDASSMFPFDFTERMVDPTARFQASYRRPDLHDEIVVFGYDLAAGADASADYCCLIVIAVNRQTLRRRGLWAHRAKGLGFDAQVQLLRDTCRRFEVAVGVVEVNGFQRWIKEACERYPETSSRVFGHTTGRDKGSLEDGVPALKIGIVAGSWDGALPAGPSLWTRLLPWPPVSEPMADLGSTADGRHTGGKGKCP